MFGLLCKRLLPNRRVVGISADSQVGFPQILISPINSFSSSSSAAENEQQQSFRVSYLTNSCGLSLERAKSLSEKIHFQSPEKPDSVLALLRNHGFTSTHITKTVNIRPSILLANPEKTLLPKLEYYRSIGISSTDLPKMIALNPSLLAHSIEKVIVPFYNFIKSVVIVDEKVVIAFKKLSIWNTFLVKNTIGPNIGVLRDLGVPASNITLFLTRHPGGLFRNCDRFSKCVEEVIKMGFEPTRLAFVLALQVTTVMTKSTWQHKMEVYGRWGWSENDILAAYRSNPICMNLSEYKIMSGMDFLVNRMGCKYLYIARNPTVLTLSLEKRIIPRCSVIQVLLSKGLMKKDFSLTSVLLPSEKHFLDRYVTKYQEDVPQLSSVYQGKMNLLK